MVIMVHVVKVVNIVHTQSIFDAPMRRWSLRPTLDLDSDSFNHRDELDSTIQLPNFRSVGSWKVACCIRVLYGAYAQAIHGIT